MESLGNYLKAERERQGLSREEAARTTKIREYFLRAIEEDRDDRLPHPFYVKGFLDAYSRCLGLDPCDVLGRYQSRMPGPVLPVPERPPTRISPATICFRTRRRTHWSWPLMVPALMGLFLFSLFALTGLDELVGWFSASSPEKESILSRSKMGEAAKAIQGEISMLRETEARDVTPAKESPFEVLQADLGKSIELEGGRSVLKQSCQEFSCADERAYFFTRIKAPKEGKITHIWLWEGKEFQKTELDVKSPVWLIYSYVTLRPGYSGNWTVEVRDGPTVLAALPFKAVDKKAD